MLQAFESSVNEIIKGLDKIAVKYEKVIPKLDAFEDEISRFFKSIQVGFARKYSDKEAQTLAENYVGKTIEWNAKQIKEQFVRVLGIDPIQAEPFLKPIRENAISQNVNLITSIPEEHFAKIERMVREAVSSGKLNSDLAKDIRKNFENDIANVTNNVEARARLIARDQIAKINSNINAARQQSLGMTEYIWRTKGDERVRSSHAKLDGKKFSWSDPPTVDGKRVNPGEDYQCRCTAEPVFSSSNILENTLLGKALSE